MDGWRDGWRDYGWRDDGEVENKWPQKGTEGEGGAGLGERGGGVDNLMGNAAMMATDADTIIITIVIEPETESKRPFHAGPKTRLSIQRTYR